MKAGRPPVKYSDQEAQGLGIDLIMWLEGDGVSEMFFEPWYHKRHKMFRSEWKALYKRVIFIPYYEIARKLISSNIIKNKLIRDSFAHRYLCFYDDELLAHEEAKADRQIERQIKAKIKELETSGVTADMVVKSIRDGTIAELLRQGKAVHKDSLKAVI